MADEIKSLEELQGAVDGTVADAPAADQAVTREPVRDELGRAYATGKRKDAVARVWVKQGPGNITVNGKVTWYEASPMAKRGFCATCGSFLFWKAHDESTISFALGAIDGPTGLALEKHIFTADKGDYYEITDDLPQKP